MAMNRREFFGTVAAVVGAAVLVRDVAPVPQPVTLATEPIVFDDAWHLMPAKADGQYLYATPSISKGRIDQAAGQRIYTLKFRYSTPSFGYIEGRT